jgi:transposase
MTSAEEAEIIALREQGLDNAEIAARLGIPRGTVQSPAHRLQQRGLIAPRPRGGAYPSQQAKARSGTEGGPSTVHPHTWELRQLKHSVRWTVYVPQAMKEELQRRASTRGENPSVLVHEALARWLAEEG